MRMNQTVFFNAAKSFSLTVAFQTNHKYHKNITFLPQLSENKPPNRRWKATKSLRTQELLFYISWWRIRKVQTSSKHKSESGEESMGNRHKSSPVIDDSPCVVVLSLIIVVPLLLGGGDGAILRLAAPAALRRWFAATRSRRSRRCRRDARRVRFPADVFCIWQFVVFLPLHSSETKHNWNWYLIKQLTR